MLFFMLCGTNEAFGKKRVAFDEEEWMRKRQHRVEGMKDGRQECNGEEGGGHNSHSGLKVKLISLSILVR